jgi:hypothetical protein
MFINIWSTRRASSSATACFQLSTRLRLFKRRFAPREKRSCPWCGPSDNRAGVRTRQ